MGSTTKFGESAMPGDDYRMTENATPGVAVYTDPEKRGVIVYFAVDDVDRAVRDLGGARSGEGGGRHIHRGG